MPAAPLTGQVATTSSPQPMAHTPSNPSYWRLKAPRANDSAIFIGGKDVDLSTGYPLEPGDEIEFDRRISPGGAFDLTPADLYVVGSGGIAARLEFR